MKKKQFSRKLMLNKETVSNLNFEEMRNSRAGGDKTELGITCRTGLCCPSAQPGCIPEMNPMFRTRGFCNSNGVFCFSVVKHCD